VDEYDSQVPENREALEALPGVGRKTANVVLNTAFGHPTIAVDTHIYSCSNRTKVAPGKTVRQVEDKLIKVVPGRVQGRRAPLADTARTLRVHSPQTTLRQLHHRGPV
jgi:endonuclease III